MLRNIIYMQVDNEFTYTLDCAWDRWQLSRCILRLGSGYGVFFFTTKGSTWRDRIGGTWVINPSYLPGKTKESGRACNSRGRDGAWDMRINELRTSGEGEVAKDSGEGARSLCGWNCRRSKIQTPNKKNTLSKYVLVYLFAFVVVFGLAT